MRIENTDEYFSALNAWKEKVAKNLNSANKKLLFLPDDIAKLEYMRDLGFPGSYPFTRGIHPDMYMGKLWTMRQFAGFGLPRQTNERFKFLLSQGQTGLSVAFDTPTIMGRDSDHPLAEGEIGRCGVAVDSIQDMEIIFSDIPLNKVTTSMTINAPAAILLAMYIVTAERQGVKSTEISGTIQNDILKEYHAQNTWIYPPKPSLELITDIMAFCSDYVPKWNTISISGYHIREAGATALQELAFTLADGFAYVEAGISAGLDVDRFAPRLSFFFSAHSNFFEEIAKFRAARRIWARHMREKYKAKNPASWMMRFHTQTAGSTLTAQQPENNIVRTAFQALAAVLGQTQSLHTNSMDEALALPTEKAVTIALRTQQIIAEELGVTELIDPLAGSYCIESLTQKMEEGAEEYFANIERQGGMIKAIENGFFRREIAMSAYEYQKEIETKRRIIVGVNKYVDPVPSQLELLQVDQEVEKEQKNNLKKFKKTRDNGKVADVLRKLEYEASCPFGQRKNLMLPILDCVRAGATLGEICDVFRRTFGEFSEQQMGKRIFI